MEQFIEFEGFEAVLTIQFEWFAHEFFDLILDFVFGLVSEKVVDIEWFGLFALA